MLQAKRAELNGVRAKQNQVLPFIKKLKNKIQHNLDLRDMLISQSI